MSTLRKFLIEKGFQRIKLTLTPTNHLKVEANINGVEGDFIVDTGASNSCVGMDDAEHFNLFSEDSDIKAAGAGATDMLTRVSVKNKVQIKKWKKKKIDLVLFDLSHVNTALMQHEAGAVHGIIGADILKKGKAIIDYKSNCLYLK